MKTVLIYPIIYRVVRKSAMPMISRTPLLIIGLMPYVLAGCSALGGNEATPQKEPARLNIAISADADLNTDIKGRGAPVLLRIYELRSDVAFQDAAFFALQNTDKTVLGADLLAVDQFILRPGETRQIVRKSNPETTAIGIFAGYRDLPNATWRLVHRMPVAAEQGWYRVVMPANKTRLKIDLHANALQVTDEAAGKATAQYAEESIKALSPSTVDTPKQPSQSLTESAGEAVKNLLKLPAK